MKLLVNQAYENMGLRSTQLLGSILDGLMRHTPEGLGWRKLIDEKGIREALRQRDAPFGDYSAGRKP
jgi:enoyl-CoA hydratase